MTSVSFCCHHTHLSPVALAAFGHSEYLHIVKKRFIFKLLCLYTVLEIIMERWVRVQNERDRQVLAWLRSQVSDAAIISAATQCAGSGGKPYLTKVCQALGARPPRNLGARATHSAVGERYLAHIYAILQQPSARVSAGA